MPEIRKAINVLYLGRREDDPAPLTGDADIISQVMLLMVRNMFNRELDNYDSFTFIAGERKEITDTMQLQAATTIERDIGRCEAFEPHETLYDQLPDQNANPPRIAKFEPYRGKIRKPGTGGIYMINDHLYEGRYTPTNAHGKREAHNIYAKTREECEKLLEEMIVEVREKIKADKERLKAETIASKSAPQ